MALIEKNELFLLEEIVKKNFAAKYKDSILGIFWSILKPLLIMILLTIIFSNLFGGSIENYPVYFLSGKIIFDFFNSATSVSMMSLKGNINILKRTAAPKHIFTLAGVVSEFLNFLITLIILIGVMIVTRSPFYILESMIAIIPIMSLIIMITGISLILAVLCVYFSDIQHLWGVITLMLMYASAIFYPMNIIPEPFHGIMILNPIFWVIGQFRILVLWGTIPSRMNMLNLVLLSVIILVFGIIVFKKFEKKITLKF
ncbi:polysaccharide/polyol phosphate ABC transporter permease protein [Methanobrevibacter ruminantium M1]|uniref:Polysaccharide/polyol phosphate ABC transporter permease protein n=1 Tax=Methanobrevibacter ruminantium (strain ATCC 35063 / DSM 1093 / JCM 13430 / OCM 146 / M1) TaxID=634498 RepID=D3E310_METRM|nr:ABC transporter permease [Methanobrevibacter ruminantium]ADC46921.1 polysaccharide/polyol phosphate ABC transporter permease protein [Methanobrevibacter ruminantium M1]